MKTPVACRLCFLLLTVTLSACLSSCNRGGHRTYYIGVSQCSEDDWRTKMNDEIMREALFHDNIEVQIKSADGTNETQIKDIREFVGRDIDLLIVSPNEAQALSPVITEAYSKGIPVITVDRDITGDSYTTHIEIDNEAIGEEAARYAARKLSDHPGGIKAIELQGDLNMTPAKKRHEGFAKGLADVYPGALIASIDCDWRGDVAADVSDSLLQIYPEINFIFAHNDNMALKVAARLDELKRTDITIVGIDGIPNEGIKGVAEGSIDATILYPTEGGHIVKKALEILEGQPTVKSELIRPLPPVEKSEAEMLLQQDRLLQEETKEILLLRDKVTEYFDLYTMQRLWLFTTVVIIIVLFSLLFFMVGKTWKRIKVERRLKLEEEVETGNLNDTSGETETKHHRGDRNPEESEFYSRFLRIVRDNIHNPNLNIDDIASDIGLSKSQLGRRIKSLTGLTPVEIIRNERLKMAKVLLTASLEKSVSEVAYEVGFSLPSYFSKCYRDFYGESPTEVRKRVFG